MHERKSVGMFLEVIIGKSTECLKNCEVSQMSKLSIKRWLVDGIHAVNKTYVKSENSSLFP